MVDGWKKEMQEISNEDVQPKIDILSKELHELVTKINSLEFDMQSKSSECDNRNKEIQGSPQWLVVTHHLVFYNQALSRPGSSWGQKISDLIALNYNGVLPTLGNF